MREKAAPWIPAIFCAVLAAIVTVADLWIYAKTGSRGGVTMIFMLNLPICFFIVGAYLTRLRDENQEMRLRLDAIESAGPED